MKYFLGALKPKVDKRDYLVAAGASELPTTFAHADLSPVKNQRSVSSCVAHATSSILEFFNKKETGKFVSLSTNFIYGMQGVALGRLEGGMYLRDACKIVKEYGDATEKSVNGNTEQPKCTEWLKEKLTDEIYDEAKSFRVASYAKCTTAKDIKHALVNYGPVLASIKWYDKYSFPVGDKIVFDKTTEYGYHAIMICGYNEEGWLCQNSWGRTWNGDGHFVYPYSEKLAEAWSFVDADSEDIIIPVNNNWLDYFYKILNFICNLFKGRN